MEETRSTFGSRLKLARQEVRLKQEQVARYLKVTPSAVSAMENGQRKVDAMELLYLSKLYGKPLEWFFDEPVLQGQRLPQRWHDHDPLIREILFLLEKATPELRQRAAYGVLGFLSDR